MKMVEVWLIFNLLLPFSDVLLHTYTDHVRSALDECREINHHGSTVKVGEGDHDDVERKEVMDTPDSYDKNLISVDEKTQDAAMRNDDNLVW